MFNLVGLQSPTSLQRKGHNKPLPRCLQTLVPLFVNLNLHAGKTDEHFFIK